MNLHLCPYCGAEKPKARARTCDKPACREKHRARCRGTETMTETMIDAALSARTLPLGGLTVLDVGGMGVKIEINDPYADAFLLSPGRAEQLCCWLAVRFPVVRNYLEQLRRDVAEARGQLAAGTVEGPTLGERILEGIKTARPGKRRDGTKSGNQRWLADKLGVPQMTVSRYVRDISIPEPEFARKLARVLGWSDDYMDGLIHAAKLRKLQNGKDRWEV